MSGRDPIGKTLHLLRRMLDGQSREWGVRELAEVSDLAPSTVHRLLTDLEGEGLVRKGGDGKYGIGLEFYRMAWQAELRFPVRYVAMRHMRDVVAGCNETMFLGLYDPGRMQMVLAASIESTHQLRYVVPLNEWIPVWCGASGLGIMAFLPQEERKAIIDRFGLSPLTDATITDPTALEMELARIRESGYACTRGQRIPGAVGIAAPIFNPGGRVIGDLLFTIPDQRFDPHDEPIYADLIMRAAQGVTLDLAGSATGARPREMRSRSDTRASGGRGS